MNNGQSYNWAEMTMAVCYYPEHWDRELRAQDLDRMLAAGITVIRIAEFAWNKVEPEVLNASKDGVLYRHGGRKHYNFKNAVYF